MGGDSGRAPGFSRHFMIIAWESAGGSDVGRLRRGNEDTLRMDPERGLFLVAAGMGGHAAGEVASDLAASTAEETLAAAVDAGANGEALDKALRLAFQRAYEAIVDCCRSSSFATAAATSASTWASEAFSTFCMFLLEKALGLLIHN